MKYLLLLVLNLIALTGFSQETAKSLKLILVTYDGCRWQEVFRGADKRLLKRLAHSKLDTALVRGVSEGTHAEKRKALSPFLWNVVAEKGMLIGNRDKGNTLALTNPYLFSYPGYSELFCGYVDRHVNSNKYPDNPNKGMVDFLCEDSAYKNAIAIFSNWDAFPRILNSNRNSIPMYCEYVSADSLHRKQYSCYAGFTTSIPEPSPYALKDTLVFHHAKEYIHRNHPRVSFIGFDETDHFGHENNYPAYIGAINQLDRYMNDLWTMVQSDSFYKDQTMIAITCDHGRGGAFANMWRHHGFPVPNSRFTWLAIMGPGVPAIGEWKEVHVAYHNQIAATLVKLLGKDYKIDKHHVGRPIKEVIEPKSKQ
ncbi:MAG: hypothetical protein U0T73_12110 [Chitinophagales bacterium]